MNKSFPIYALLYLVTGGIIASVFLWTPHVKNDFPLLRVIIIAFATVLLTKYFFYMVTAPWFEVWKRYDEKKWPQKTPKVSILIPAYNEEVGLLATVKTILASEYRNIEIIVINDGSTDSSDALMRQFLAKQIMLGGIEVKYFYKENGGKGKALNYGLKRATGEIIMSIDADCVLTPTTVGNFVKRFNNPSVMAAVGNVSIGNTETLLGTIQYLEFLFSFYFKKAESLLGTIYIIGGAAGAFRKEVFEKIGEYNHANITEDIELSVRIQAAGMKIVYASDAMVYTEGAVSLAGLVKQRLRWKRGRFQTFFDHSSLFFSLRKGHNKLLTMVMLPLAYFGDIQLFCEVPFLAFLYVYSYLTHDFSSFISGVIVVSSMFLVQIAFDGKKKGKLLLIFLAPIGWLLFYISTYVEFSALIKSVWASIRKKEVVWQKWQRQGVGIAMPDITLSSIQK
jgi:cellulose synthase/poly-beta-1,6-N-acetylglucosamine synthase-like glycosyltransferase